MTRAEGQSATRQNGIEVEGKGSLHELIKARTPYLESSMFPALPVLKLPARHIELQQNIPQIHTFLIHND